MARLLLSALILLFTLSSSAQNNCQVSYQYTLGLCPNILFFSDVSPDDIPNTSFLWDFGDGAFSTEANPEHLYTASGIYEVCLTIEVNGCSSTSCDLIQVPCIEDDDCHAGFHYASTACGEYFFFSSSFSTGSQEYDLTWSFGDGSAGTGLGPQHTYTQNGTYEVCVTITTDDGCTDTYCEGVTVDCYPDPPECETAFTWNLFYCPTVNFTASTTAPPPDGSDFLWDFGDGTTATGPNPSHTYVAFGPFEVCLTTVDPFGCEVQHCKTIFITCLAPPCETVFFVGIGTECPEVQFIGYTLTPPPANDSGWQWDFGDGNTGIGPEPLHTYSANGTYVVCLTTTDPAGCMATFCEQVTIDCYPPPCETFFQYTLGLCPEILFFGSTTVPAPNDDSDWQWDFGDGSSGIGPSPTHTYAANGSYTVCLTTTDASGCFSQYCDIIAISCIPECHAAFQYTLANCPVVEFFGGSSVPPPGTIEDWQWDFGDGTSGSGPNPTHEFAGNGIYTVCLVITDATGCTSDYCEGVEINCIPPPCVNSFEYSLEDCPTVAFAGISTIPPSNEAYWQWSFGDGSTGTGPNLTHTYSENGEYTVCVWIADPFGCDFEYCETIIIDCIPPPPCAAFISYTLGLCPEILFFGNSNTVADPVNWHWDFGDGNISTEQNPSHTYTENGAYTVCLVITTADGCVAEHCETIHITCIPSCEISFDYTLAGCPEVEFVGATTAPPPDDQDWLWHFGDGSSATGPNPTHTYTQNGSYTVCLQTVDPFGCTAEYCEVVEINCIPPACEAFFQYTLGLCPEILFFGSTNTPAPLPDTEYAWDFGDGHSSTDQNPAHTYTTNGTYTVCLIITTADGCMADHCETITINCIPSCEITFQYTLANCPTVEFFGATTTPSPGDDDWFWQFGDGSTGTGPNPMHTYSENGIYTVCLTTTDPFGCTATYCEIVEITCIPPTCEAFFQYTLGACPDIHFFGVSNTLANPVSWHWEFGDGNTSTDQNPVHTYASNGTYTVCLIITSANGCVADHCEVITINCIPPACEAFFEYSLDDCPIVHFFSANSNPPPGTNAWHWDFGDGSTGLGQNPEHTYEENGFYEVCLTVVYSPNCTATYCEEIPIKCIATGIDEAFASNISVYPNPVNEFVHVRMDRVYSELEVSLQSINGKLLKSRSIQNLTEFELDMKELPAGMYLLTISTDEYVGTLKLIKK